MKSSTHAVQVETNKGHTTLTVPHGTSLREALLSAGLTPYGALTHRANCGGRGLCATCGVWVTNGPEPTHWHDRAAQRFGYPRLSCQITVNGSMSIKLIPDKIAWGKLIPDLSGGAR